MGTKTTDPPTQIDKDLFYTVVDTLSALEDQIIPNLPSRAIIIVSTLSNIVRLYKVDLVPTEFSKYTDAIPQELADMRTFHQYWLAHFLGSRDSKL